MKLKNEVLSNKEKVFWEGLHMEFMSIVTIWEEREKLTLTD